MSVRCARRFLGSVKKISRQLVIGGGSMTGIALLVEDIALPIPNIGRSSMQLSARAMPKMLKRSAAQGVICGNQAMLARLRRRHAIVEVRARAAQA